MSIRYLSGINVDSNTLFVDSTNNKVGIGISTPSAKLDIDGAHVASIGLLRLNSNAANMSAMTYYIDGVYKAATYAGTDDNFYLWGRDADIVFNTTTSGTTRMVITNGGNVGIGISGPTQKLTVGGSIRVTGGYYDSSNSVGSNGQVLASTGTGTTWINASGGTVNGSGTVNYLSKWTGTTLLGDSVIYDNGTNVGIGTAVPGQKVDVVGASAADTYLRVLGGAGTTKGGIIVGNNDSGKNYGSLFFDNANNNVYLYQQYSSGDLVLGTNTNEKMRITSAGNVGIGNTNPTQKLHVEGNIRVTGAYYDSANGAGSSGQVLSSTGSGTSWITPFSGSGTTNYVSKWTSGTALGNSQIFDNGTNVGIGTATPSEKLSVSGNINVVASTGSKIGFNTTDAFAAYSTSVAHYGISYGWNTNPIAISGYFGVGVFTSGTERMRIDGSGFVGIGTTSPSRLLHVAGNAQVDGWIFQGGYYTGSITLPYPGANYGNGRIYLRLCSSASGRIMTAKVRISSTWNWAPAFGSVEADISFYWDGSSLVYSYVNILSATGLAATNLTFGALAVEGGSISVPVYSTNSNPIFTYIQLSPDADPSQVSYSTWSSVSFPGQSNVYVQTSLGVGTTSPSALLHVNGTFRSNSFFTLSNGISYWGPNGVEYGYLTWDTGYARVGASGSNTLYLGGSNQITILTGGNVGIGETSPSQKLHVTGNVRVSGAYYDSSNVAGTSGQILSSTGTGTAWISPGGGGGIITGSGTTNYVTKWTSGTAVGDSSIYDNGSVVSVGTASPYSGLSTRLYVGYAQNNSVVNQNEFISVGAAGGSTNQAGINFLIYNAAYGGRIYTDDSTVRGLAFDVLEGGTFYNAISITRTTSPNVGIGTTAPQKPLEVISGVNNFVSVGVSQMSVGNWSGIHFGYREANSSYRKSAIVFERTDLTANDAQGKIHILNGPQGGSGSATLADAKLTIAENGNVGVGATSPTSKLTIIAGANSFEDGSNAIRIEYPGSPSNGEIGGGLVFAQRWFSGAPDSLVRTGGIYGVKTNTNGAYGGGLVFYTQPNNGDPMGERMRINSLGSVGINTTNPGYKLDVIGSVRSYGGLFSNGYHGDTYIENLLPAANNGAGTGDVQLRMWCSEPGVTWAWAGFGYNVRNDGNAPAGFSRVNTSFGQAYMRFSTEGDLFFYNTNTSATRVTTMTLTNAGSVGINETAPSQKLHVSGNVRVTGAYYDSANSAGTSGQILSSTGTGTAWISPGGGGGIITGSGTTNYVTKWTSGTAVGDSSIFDNGNVGIGTTLPDSKLRIQNDNATVPSLTIRDGGTPTVDHIRVSSGTYGDAFFVKATGLVGIGTASPLKRLVVTTANNTNSSNHKSDALAYFGGGNDNPDAQNISFPNPSITDGSISGMAWWSADVMFGRYKNEAFWSIKETHGGSLGNSQRDIIRCYFYDSGGYSYIDKTVIPSGNVGIGTTGPTSKLQVETGGDGNVLQLKGAGGNTTDFGFDSIGGYIETNGASTGRQRLRLQTYNGSAYTQLFIDGGNQRIYTSSNVNVGIGTTAPAAKLDVVGVIRYGDNGSSIGALSYGTGVVTLEASSANTHVSIIPSGTGNVGISTLTPSQKLHVSGNIRVTGAYYDSANSAGTSGQVLSSTGTGTAWINQGGGTAASLYDLLPAGRVAYNWVGQVVNDAWTTVFTKNDNILTTGTWMVKMYVNDFSVGGGHYQYVYSGIMTWDQGSVNQTGEAAFSEVYLHRMGHAANASVVYLRTAESGAAGGNIGYFQIKGNYSNTSNQTIQFQFVKIF